MSFPARQVADAAGATPSRWRRVASGGYGRVNEHWRVTEGGPDTWKVMPG